MTATVQPQGCLNYEKNWRVLAWMLVAIVVWLSLTPRPPQPPSILGWDKAQHFTAYATLAYWFGMCYSRHWRWPTFLVGLGVLMEVLQGLGGFRSFDFFDIIANTIGVAGGFWLEGTCAGLWLAAFDTWLANRVGPPA
ncbi:MAG: VanZ family protein [Candidatus Methylumidiphilus sp.]